jgi:hypothetical protein
VSFVTTRTLLKIVQRRLLSAVLGVVTIALGLLPSPRHTSLAGGDIAARSRDGVWQVVAAEWP